MAMPQDTHICVAEGWMDALHSCHCQRQLLQVPKLAAQVIVGTDDTDHGLLACSPCLKTHRKPLHAPLLLLHPLHFPHGLASQPSPEEPALPPTGATAGKGARQNGDVRKSAKTRERLSVTPQQPQQSQRQIILFLLQDTKAAPRAVLPAITIVKEKPKMIIGE